MSIRAQVRTTVRQDTCHKVLTGCFSLVFSFVVSAAAYADAPPTPTRDEAIRRIDACVLRNDFGSVECQALDEDVKSLVASYRGSDKSVLPTLMRWASLGEAHSDFFQYQYRWMTDLFAEALLADREGFLTVMSTLPKTDQQAVAMIMAGGTFGIARPRFEALRASLSGIPGSSAVYEAAQQSKRALEAGNTAYLVTYFPPEAFKGPDSMSTRFYSRDLFALGAKPLWPPASTQPQIYRLMRVPSLAGPELVTLTLLPDGTGSLETRTANMSRASSELELVSEKTATVDREQVATFKSLIALSGYWKMPTQVAPRVLDGTVWMLEVAQDGKYHVVVRSSPGQSHFGQATEFLLQLAERNVGADY
jgi:hypothetical protein